MRFERFPEMNLKTFERIHDPITNDEKGPEETKKTTYMIL